MNDNRPKQQDQKNVPSPTNSMGQRVFRRLPDCPGPVYGIGRANHVSGKAKIASVLTIRSCKRVLVSFARSDPRIADDTGLDMGLGLFLL